MKHIKKYLLEIILIAVCVFWFIDIFISGDRGNNHILGIIVMAAFYLLIFLVGAWAGKRIRSDEAESFILAGRKMPLWIGVFTMAATWLGGGYINGTAEQAYSNGLLWAQAPWGYALSLIIGGLFFARRMHKFGFYTMLDPLARRYGNKSAGLFFLPALCGEIFWIGAILTAIATTFSVIMDLDVQSSILISAIIAVLYTVIGGLWAVAYTDIVQLILLAFGLVAVMPFLVVDSEGLTQLWMQYKEVHGSAAYIWPDFSEMGNWYWNWWDYALLLVFGGIPWQVYFQRVLAAKTASNAMYLSILAGFICLLAAIPAALVGMVGAVTDWNSMGLSGPDNPALILPYVFRFMTPEIVAVLGLAAIAAAVMSSIDSSMLSASSMGVWNVYLPLINPSLDKRLVIKLIRRCIYIVGTAAAILALQVKSVYALWYLCSDFVYCLLFPALVCALFDPKTNRYGALSGLFIAAIFRFGGGDTTLGIPILLPYPMIEEGAVLFPFRTFAMVTGLLTNLIVSRLTQSVCPPVQLKIERV